MNVSGAKYMYESVQKKLLCFYQNLSYTTKTFQNVLPRLIIHKTFNIGYYIEMIHHMCKQA